MVAITRRVMGRWATRCRLEGEIVRKLLIVLVFIALLGCQPVVIAPVVVTATEAQVTQVATPWPTNTPTATWTGDCVPAGIFPMNRNPCLKPDPRITEADDMTFEIIPNGNWGETLGGFDYVGDQMVMDLHGGEGFAGEMLVTVHGLELVSGRCYVANFNGRLDLRDVDITLGRDNFQAVARILKDDGTVVELPSQTVLRGDPEVTGPANITGDRDFFWGFYSNDPRPTIALQVGIREIWAEAHHGNSFWIEAIYVYLTDDNAHCAGGAGF